MQAACKRRGEPKASASGLGTASGCVRVRQGAPSRREPWAREQRLKTWRQDYAYGTRFTDRFHPHGAASAQLLAVAVNGQGGPVGLGVRDGDCSTYTHGSAHNLSLLTHPKPAMALCGLGAIPGLNHPPPPLPCPPPFPPTFANTCTDVHS